MKLEYLSKFPSNSRYYQRTYCTIVQYGRYNWLHQLVCCWISPFTWRYPAALHWGFSWSIWSFISEKIGRLSKKITAKHSVQFKGRIAWLQHKYIEASRLPSADDVLLSTKNPEGHLYKTGEGSSVLVVRFCTRFRILPVAGEDVPKVMSMRQRGRNSFTWRKRKVRIRW